MNIDEKELNISRTKTVQDILDLLKTNDRVACVRYTGYGKSYYIVTQLVNKLNKPILIVVPNAALHEQYKELFDDNKNVKIITYQIIKNFTNSYIKEHLLKYEYIICDECHHLGNNKWRKHFDKLNSIIKAKVIGLTATPLRGDNVNVVEQYFNNVQVDPLELIDGISLNYVPKIKYIVAYASIDDLQNYKLKEIDRYKIQNLINIPNILKKHIPKQICNNNMKILVYVPKIKYIEEGINSCQNWFKQIFPNFNINTYSIHSEKDTTLNKRELSQFKQYHSNSIDIMVSVDMLTEGLHLPTINIEIMLRKTKSPVTYFQQVGRVINGQQPIVFDLINNSSHLYQMKQQYKLNINEIQNRQLRKPKVMFNECVKLYDETKEIQNILEKYKIQYKTMDQINAILLENKEYIQNNPDKLSFNAMCKKLGISNTGFEAGIVRLGITFDRELYIEYQKKYYKQIQQNKEFIEDKSGKISYRELSDMLNIPRFLLVRAIKELNINFKTPYSTHSTKYIDTFVKQHKQDILKLMNNNIPIEQQAKSFGFSSPSYKKALINNNIKINWLWQKFEDKYDINIYNKFEQLYINNHSKKEIQQILNIDDIVYASYRGKCYSKGIRRIQERSKDKNKLTSQDKQFIKDNFNKYTTKELCQILNKPCTRIKDFKRLQNLKRDDYVPFKKLTQNQKQQIETLYKSNKTLSFREIGRRVNCSDSSVRSYLEKIGLHNPTPRKYVLGSYDTQIVEKYKSGVSKTDIEKEYHIGHKMLNNVLDSGGIKNHRRCQ